MQFFLRYPNIAVILSSFFWGSYWIPIRYINEIGKNSVWPIIISFLLLSIILIFPLIKSIKLLLKNKDIFFFLGNLISALGIALYSESLLRGEIAKVVLLFYLCPVWGTILAKVILNKKFNFQRYISLFLGIIGLEIILGFDEGVFFPSMIVEYMALAAGFFWALGLTFFHLSKTSEGVEKTAFTSIFIPIFFLILILVPGGRDMGITNINFSFNILLLWIFLFSIIWLLPSILLTYMSVEVLDPGRINILLMFEVIIGITTAALLTTEIIGIREMIGAIVIISAGAIDLIKIKS